MRTLSQATMETGTPSSPAADGPSDALLLAGLREGDQAAFESLFLRYREPIARFLSRLLGDGDEAEDMVQEAFLRLHRHPLSAGHEQNVRAWLYRVAANLGYNALRGRQRREKREAAAQSAANVEVDPTDTAVAAEQRQEVRRALSGLSLRHQTCLLLRHQGLSYAEIAQVVGVAASSVGTILARAEADFKRHYTGKENPL